jgi:hypothetical protein
MRIKRYKDFVSESVKVNENIFLKDDFLRSELEKMGVKGEELERQIRLAKKGSLSEYLEAKGGKFTFGLLRAIFRDAREAKIGTSFKKAVWQSLPRAIPLLLAPFFPTLAIIGLIFGTSRLANKFFKPILSDIDSDSKYLDFLNNTIQTVMKIPEGDVSVEDKFSKAFVVSDRLIDALKPEVLDEFCRQLSKRMDQKPDDEQVPDHYVENELKKYLNDNYDVDPEIPLKE